jgi:hypothetical protein
MAPALQARIGLVRIRPKTEAPFSDRLVLPAIELDD